MRAIKLSLVFFFIIISSCINSNETTMSAGKTVNGKKQGEWKTYYSSNGNLCRLENFLNDTLDGLSLIYQPDGTIYTKANFKMGILVDSFLHYHSNGKLNFQTWRDSNGKEQGTFRLYHSNGHLSQVGLKKDDHMEGIWKTFFQSGKLKTIEVYDDNGKEGIWSYFDENGNKVKTEYYNNDTLVKQ